MNTRTALPEGVISLPGHEAHARGVLDANAWAYFAGGAADEHTLNANPAAWQKLQLHPRILRPVAGGHTRVSLLGRSLAHPILLAPVAYQRMAHPDGEIGTALAASAQRAGLVLSTQASTPLEAVADAIRNDPDRGPLWFQLYLQHDRGFNLELIHRAEAAGYEALVLTVDAPCNGARDRERQAGFRLPPGISAVNLSRLVPRPDPARHPHQSALFDGLLQQAPTWDDIAWLQASTRLPLILKGVLHPDDAREAARQQVGGLIVSNHGGRTLDTLPPTAEVLPEIVEALGGSLPVLVDGGIRRGTDVLKAMALGAAAVLIGRPYIYGLANAGALGVAHVIRLLRDELEIAMALSGCPTLGDIPADLVRRARN